MTTDETITLASGNTLSFEEVSRTAVPTRLWWGLLAAESRARIAAELEGACKLVMALGYATGHADTFEQLVENVKEELATTLTNELRAELAKVIFTRK